MQRLDTNVRGFTLIDTIVVVTIAAVIMAIAVPIANTIISNFRLQNAVMAITGAIQATRMEAISTTLPMKVTFSKATNTYQAAFCSTCNVYATTGAYTNGHAPKTPGGQPFLPNPVAFSGAGSGVTLSADTTFYLRPGGAVQTTEGTTSCPTLAPFTLSYRGTTKTITVGCYGQITVTP